MTRRNFTTTRWQSWSAVGALYFHFGCFRHFRTPFGRAGCSPSLCAISAGWRSVPCHGRPMTGTGVYTVGLRQCRMRPSRYSVRSFSRPSRWVVKYCNFAALPAYLLLVRSLMLRFWRWRTGTALLLADGFASSTSISSLGPTCREESLARCGRALASWLFQRRLRAMLSILMAGLAHENGVTGTAR